MKYKEYDGLKLSDLKHIPEISYYNHNYYIGIKCEDEVCNHLIFVLSFDDNRSNLYISKPWGMEEIGECFASEGNIIYVYDVNERDTI